MPNDNELSRLFSSPRFLSGAHRAIRLRLDHMCGGLNDVLLPQTVIGTARVCGTLRYEVWCVSTERRLPLKEFIALPCAIDFVTDRGALHSVCGIVTEACAGDSDGGVATYKLLIRDALAIFEKRVNTRVFRGMNEYDIVQLLVNEWRHDNSIIASAFELSHDESLLLREFPRREFTMQYNESDAAFVRRLLARRGIGWYFRPSLSQDRGEPAHVMVLFNQPDCLQQCSAATVRYHRDDATEQRDTITSWAAARRLQAGAVSLHSWDYQNPRGTSLMRSDVRSYSNQGTSGNELAASLNDYQVLPPHTASSHDDLCQLGRIRVTRHELETKCFYGQGSVRDLVAGEYFTLSGHPEIDTHPQAERDFVVTELRIAARNNLPTKLAERIERLFNRNGWTAGLSTDSLQFSSMRTHTAFTAVRRGIPIVPAFDPRSDVPQAAIQSAIVVGPEDEEVYCDRLGRVKIRFVGTRGMDHQHAQGAGASNSPSDSAWVRVASGWAGNGPGSARQCGALCLPRVGTEVLIAFLGGDPDKPVIIGQLYNDVAEPAGLSELGDLPGNRYLSGLKSREIQGKRHNRLSFDDTRGRINVQLSSDHGSSQLNLGWLTEPLCAGDGKPRGEGAELRSDRAVAVRGAEGVLISADAGGGADGAQLARGELVRVAEGLSKLAAQLGKLAMQHAGDAESAKEIAALVDKLSHLDDGTNVGEKSAAGAEPIVAISGPAGVAIGSAQSVAIGAGDNVSIVSSGATEFSSAGATLMRSARGVSLFSHQDDLKLTAAAGKVQAQAQDGAMELLARRVLDIISTTDWINLKAKQGVRINGGGSELVIDGSGIKGYTSGNNEMYAADHRTFGPKSVPVQFGGFKLCGSFASGAAQGGSASVPSLD